MTTWNVKRVVRRDEAVQSLHSFYHFIVHCFDFPAHNFIVLVHTDRFNRFPTNNN